MQHFLSYKDPGSDRECECAPCVYGLLTFRDLQIAMKV